MKKILLLIIGVAIFFAGCSSPESNSNENPIIATSFYPVEEITKEITSNTSNVKVLVSAGNEPHSYQPTPSQIVSLSKANSFVTMGGIFEHVEETIIEANANMNVIDSSKSLYKIDDNHEDENHEDENHHDHELQKDPHTWLSISNMITMTQTIEEELIEQYPQHEELYQQNAREYISRLETLKNNYSTKLNNCKHDKIIVNHKAFGHIAEDYGFEQISVAGYSPKAEPTSKGIKQVIDEANKHNISYIFAEGHLDEKSAQTIAKDINGEILELNPIKRNDNQTYFTIMEKNLKNLQTGLECSN